ncbi:MAG: di-trans,poly-cis-decaprenylcistransferase [Candidatus Peregrinibacteria bacterium]|nr:di-trans,poly-cis-decaprenylcistransferase [Candidatus Peregrinibacteria bacterium]MCB9808248.1 di-trans,poly-cis-decaprenylcistransferase [Candidatus Peribacteria bacterium]
MHVAIIPDGNRRWAKKRSLHPWDGHKEAIEHFRSLTDWCRNDPRVDALTVWCFSTENWKRDKKEVSMLMKMLEEYLAKEREGFNNKNTKFIHSGRRDRIPTSLAKLIEEVEEETKDYDGFTLHLAVDYGGKDEILRAALKAKSYHLKAESEDFISPYLDHPELPDIDLIIRTSGEHRTSNFFLFQAAYAEWDFIDMLFPDFGVNELQESVDAFSSRTRRFGG